MADLRSEAGTILMILEHFVVPENKIHNEGITLKKQMSQLKELLMTKAEMI